MAGTPALSVGHESKSCSVKSLAKTEKVKTVFLAVGASVLITNIVS